MKLLRIKISSAAAAFLLLLFAGSSVCGARAETNIARGGRKAAYTAVSLETRLALKKMRDGLPKGPTGQCVKGPCPAGMCYVAPGVFVMGCAPSDKTCDAASNPARRVSLDAFCIDEKEVSQADYEEATGGNPSHFANCGGRCPVETVSWDEANDYCMGEGLRLPASAEWEKAARGTDGRMLPWTAAAEKNADLCAYAVIYGAGGGAQLGCGRNSTWETGVRPAGASPYGALDMEGNVSEWVADCANAQPAQSGHDAFGQAPECKLRAARGSNWGTPENDVRVSNTYSLDPAATSIWRADLGFRCAMSLD